MGATDFSTLQELWRTFLERGFDFLDAYTLNAGDYWTLTDRSRAAREALRAEWKRKQNAAYVMLSNSHCPLSACGEDADRAIGEQAGFLDALMDRLYYRVRKPGKASAFVLAELRAELRALSARLKAPLAEAASAPADAPPVDAADDLQLPQNLDLLKRLLRANRGKRLPAKKIELELGSAPSRLRYESRKHWRRWWDQNVGSEHGWYWWRGE